MIRGWGAWALFLSLVISAAVFGCDVEDEDEQRKHEAVKSRVPVELPAKPNLDQVLNAPRVHPDGTLTVMGLILDRNKYLGNPVQVRGIVRDASPDCPFLTDPAMKEYRPKKGERRPRTCKSVHVTIADGTLSPKALTLVAYHPYFHPHFKAGQEIVVKGNYDVQGAGFVQPRDGLVVVEEILNLAVDAEGQLYDSPEEVARIKLEGLHATR